MRYLLNVAFKLLQGIGKCPRCMNKSFVAAGFFWIFLALSLCFNYTEYTFFGVIIALPLTLLWLSHVVVFARYDVAAACIESFPDVSRRKVAAALAGSLAFAFAASIAPRWAHADGPCGGEKCGACQRPIYNSNTGGYRCQTCHSCAGPNGRYDCGGETC